MSEPRALASGTSIRTGPGRRLKEGSLWIDSCAGNRERKYLVGRRLVLIMAIVGMWVQGARLGLSEPAVQTPSIKIDVANNSELERKTKEPNRVAGQHSLR